MNYTKSLRFFVHLNPKHLKVGNFQVEFKLDSNPNVFKKKKEKKRKKKKGKRKKKTKKIKTE